MCFFSGKNTSIWHHTRPEHHTFTYTESVLVSHATSKLMEIEYLSRHVAVDSVHHKFVSISIARIWVRIRRSHPLTEMRFQFPARKTMKS